VASLGEVLHGLPGLCDQILQMSSGLAFLLVPARQLWGRAEGSSVPTENVQNEAELFYCY
jgi:hypothetical protein